jgi:hypothetical protein
LTRETLPLFKLARSIRTLLTHLYDFCPPSKEGIVSAIAIVIKVIEVVIVITSIIATVAASVI